MAVRERILAVGAPGAGKSFQLLRIAQWLKGPGKQVFVIDTDDAWPRMLSGKDLSNVRVLPAQDWPDYMKARDTVLEEAHEGDWVGLDMADSPWSTVQRYFITEVFKDEMGEYFLEARKHMKKDTKSLFGGRDSALKGWTDWVTINRLYEDFMLPLVYRSSAHLYATSKPQAVSEDDDMVTKDLFGSLGVKPAGQKALGHQFHSVFLFIHGKDGWSITTIKDREREAMDHMKLVSLPHQYLQKYMTAKVD